MKKLPKGYKRLKYIESTGTQYIDTEFKPNQDTRVVCKGQFLDISSTVNMFGTRVSTSSGRYELLVSGNYIFSSYNTAAGSSISSTTDILLIDKNKNVTSNNGKVFDTSAYAAFQANYNLLLFAGNRAGTVSGKAKCRIYFFQIYDNGILIRDYVPCMDSNGVAGLYDFVNDVFYTNAGTGTFIAGPEYDPENPWVLPTGYSRLEYIESTGTQYIDTGIKPTSNVDVMVDFRLTATSSEWVCVFGGRDASANNNTLALWHDNSVFRFYRGLNNTQNSFAATVAALTKHCFVCEKNVAYIDGTSTSVTDATFTGTNNIYLFSMNTAGTAGSFSKCLLYSCRIYDNGTLVRNFVPCKDPSGVIGLYDAVNDVFYRNAGTGTIIAGPEILTEWTDLEYVESTGTQYIDTGFKPNNNSRIVIDFQYLTINSTAFFGARTSSSSNQFIFYGTTSGWKDGYATTISELGKTADTNRHILDKNKNITKLDGTTIKTNTAKTFTCPVPVALFGTNDNGTIQYFSTSRLFSCQLYDNGILVRDFIPCITSDGRIGLRNVLNNTFFPNLGGDVFVAGPIIPGTFPPLTPEDVTANYIDFANVLISWLKSDNAAAYNVMRDGVLIGETDQTFFFDNQLEKETSYRYEITAINEAGESDPETILVKTTPFKLITDRTVEDVQKVIETIKTGVLPFGWIAGMKGAYNATDLNRVESAVLFLIERLKIAGWHLIVQTKTNWSFTDFPTASEMKRYLDNVALLRSALPVGMPDMPSDADKLRFDEANTIEQVLEMLDVAVTNIMLNVYYSNEIYSGEV